MVINMETEKDSKTRENMEERINTKTNIEINAETNTETGGKIDEQDIDSLIAILDNYSQTGGSRMKIDVVDGGGEVVDRKYHHGRCDICSPWATGQAFDVLE